MPSFTSSIPGVATLTTIAALTVNQQAVNCHCFINSEATQLLEARAVASASVLAINSYLRKVEVGIGSN